MEEPWQRKEIAQEKVRHHQVVGVAAGAGAGAAAEAAAPEEVRVRLVRHRKEEREERGKKAARVAGHAERPVRDSRLPGHKARDAAGRLAAHE